MPKLFIDSRKGTFTDEARVEVAATLTDLGIACERLADTPAVRAGVWVFFTEHDPDCIFSGGEIAPNPLIRLLILALEGGLDVESKQRLIAEATAVLGKHADRSRHEATVYVVIREVPEVNWAMNGRQASLAALRSAG